MFNIRTTNKQQKKTTENCYTILRNLNIFLENKKTGGPDEYRTHMDSWRTCFINISKLVLFARFVH